MVVNRRGLLWVNYQGKDTTHVKYFFNFGNYCSFIQTPVMKSIFSSFLIFFTCCNAKEKQYVGSTPATASNVRSFLAIPIADSVDFIKWKLILNDNTYFLNCQFGVGKPNTDGFINDGNKVELKGQLTRTNNYYILQSGNKSLRLVIINDNLLHVANDNSQLLNGTSGWSYTLNAATPSDSKEVSIFSNQSSLKDSMGFGGRTPCHDFAEVHPSPSCIKIKWFIILYADSKTGQPTTFLLNSDNLRRGGKRGNWQIVRKNDGRIIYQLNSETENASIYLLKLDDNILVFTDADGNLLVGDKNFSFTLNKRF
jgi:hypothetical protein